MTRAVLHLAMMSLLLITILTTFTAANDEPSRDIGSPTNTRISVVDGAIVVEWEQPDIGSSTLTGYNVYRSVNGSSFNFIAGVDKAILAYQDEDIELMGEYGYQVTALSGPVESSPGDVVTMTYEKDPPLIDLSPDLDGSTISKESISISWTAIDEGSGLASVVLSIDGRPFQEVIPDGTREIQGLTEGKHSILISAVDRAGNDAELDTGFFVDRTKPEITILSPQEGSVVSIPLMNITWTVEDDSVIQENHIKIDSGPKRSVGSANHYIWKVPDSGRSSINISSTDAGGNIGSRKISLICDLVPPNVRITDPLDGSYIGSSSVEVAFTISDEGSGLEGLELNVDGRIEDMSPEESSYIIEDLNDGRHEVILTGVDRGGSRSTDRIEFTVDTIKPQLEIISPVEGDLIGRTDFSFNWSSGDGLSGFSRILYSLDGLRWTRLNEASGVITIQTGPGMASFHVISIDNAGNERRRSINFTIDIYNPDVVDHGPQGDPVPSDTLIWVEFNEDMLPGSVDIEVNGVPGTIEGGPRSFQFRTEGRLKPGEMYTVRIDGQDLAGNPVRGMMWSFIVKETAFIYGTVYDEKGYPLEGARIVSDSGRTALTDEDGYFEIEVKQSDRNLSVIQDGYQQKRVPLEISLSNRTRISNVFMEIDDIQKSDEASDLLNDPYNYVVGSLVLVIVILSIYLIKGSPPVERMFSK